MSSDQTVKVSVVVITFNEEHNIRRCLESVKEIADEVVVVDSLSTDNTVEICEQLGAKVFSQKFLGHVEQKNFAITKATYPHILSLDADEALDSTLLNSIKVVKDNWAHNGYTMNRLTNYCGKWIHHSGWYPDRKLRLWDSRKGQWEGTNPHDEYKLKEGSVKHIQGKILHYSYNSITEHITQANYFSDIAAKSGLIKGRKSTVFNVIFNPLFKFIRNYLLKQGFRDGFYGFVICTITAHETFLKYVKMRKMRRSSFESIYPK